MIRMRHAQPSLWDGLFAAEVADLLREYMDAEFPATIVQIGTDSHLHFAMIAFFQVSLQELAVDVSGWWLVAGYSPTDVSVLLSMFYHTCQKSADDTL